MHTYINTNINLTNTHKEKRKLHVDLSVKTIIMITDLV